MIEHYLKVRKKTEEIVSPLSIEDFVAQPVVDVSPPKWHLGHTTWFFENFILVPHCKNYQLFSNEFAFVFNSYYESQGERILRNKRGTLTRPSTEEIFEYRKYVDEKLTNFLTSIPIQDEVKKFLEIGINHEQQHQELLITDIKYILGCNPLLPKYSNFKTNNEPPITSEWLTIPEGNYSIGYDGEAFHFDNEEGEHTVFLHEFEVQNRLVTNKEFIEFIKDDGYSRPELWLMEGWEWVKNEQAKAPFYWFIKNDELHSYQLNGVEKINLNQAVTHVNFYEAEAYARWNNCRLLTEQEWEVAAKKNQKIVETNHFQEKSTYHPLSAKDNQFFGTAWEWTNSAYLPYPFYKQEEGALGEYNGKFMINQMVLRGGSCATPKSHFRPTYRNFFHPHLQWQFTGIRIARNKTK
jgi:ergothioneine biosynthesis protein EgtB